MIGQGTALAGEAAKGPPTLKVSDLGVFGGTTRYLGVTVDVGSGGYNVEISPRQQIVTSAYAFRAKYAEQIGANGATTITSLDNGNVGVGTASPGAKLDVAGGIKASGASGYTFNSGDADGGIFSPADNTMTFFTNNAERMRLVGGNFGIGVTDPQTALEVNGSITAATTGGFTFRNDADTGMFTTGNDANVLSFKTGGTEKLRVDLLGRVAIGRSDPAHTLDIRATDPTLMLSKSDGTGGSIYFGNTAHGVKRGWAIAHDVGMFTTGADIYLSASGSANYTQFVLKNSGKIGVGTTAPTYSLDIVGTSPELLLATSTGTAGAVYFGNPAHGVKRNFNGSANDVGLYTQGADLYLSANGSTTNSHFVLKNSGNVGIGTSAPGAKLAVNGTLNVTGATNIDSSLHVLQGIRTTSGVAVHPQGAHLEWNKDNASGKTYLLNQRGGGGGGIILGEVDGGNGITERISIRGDGFTTQFNTRVGIFNDNPSGNLHVSGSVTNTFFLAAYMDGDNVTAAPNGNATLAHSIVSDARVRASAFDVLSDARIKKIIGRSAGDQDLATLMQVGITNFTYKDTIEHGTKTQKKVIAQEIEAIFPQAVGRSVNVLPDIFQKAAFKNGWVELTTDLKVGDRVRLMADKHAGTHEVLEVALGRFRTDFKSDSDQVFVYGREVCDFRSVDYEAIAMLNVSATQQIKREKDAEIAALRDQVAELRAMVVALQASTSPSTASTAAVVARPAAPKSANGQE